MSRRPGRVAALRHGGQRGDGRSRPSWTGAARSVARVPVLATLVVLVVALVFPRFEGGNTSVMGLATEALTYGLVTMSLNLLMGYGGQVSVGQAGFLAVGAYTTAIVATRFGGLPFIVVLALAGLVTAAVGLVLGLPAARLRSHYLAVATLGFGLAVPEIALNGGSLTGGYTGLIVPPAAARPGHAQQSRPGVLPGAGGRAGLRRGHPQRPGQPHRPALHGGAGQPGHRPRDGHQHRADKVILFTLSAFFCGLAGYVFALNNSIVEYSSFDFSLSLFFFAAVIVGGMGSMWGSLIAAALLVVIQQEAVSLGGFSEAILGVAVVIVLLLVPGGLASLGRRTRDAIAGPRLLLRGQAAGRRRAGRAAATSGRRPPRPRARHGRADMLQIEDLSLSFGGVHAIDGLHLTVPDGTITALIGPNGAGKTSVLNVINGFFRPQRGRVLHDGLDLLSLPPYRVIQQGIARSFQNVALFGGLSVTDNLIVGFDHRSRTGFVRDLLHTPEVVRHERAARERAQEVLEFLGITGIARRRAGELGFGERKLVDLGRALMPQPALVLLDEPTAGLAEAPEGVAGGVLSRIPAEFGAAALVIDHDMRVVWASRAGVVMDFGRKIAEGTPRRGAGRPGRDHRLPGRGRGRCC